MHIALRPPFLYCRGRNIVIIDYMDIPERNDVGKTLPERDLTQVSLRAMLEACPIAMLALDRNGVVRMWSPGAEQMFGWTLEEVVGQPLPAGFELLEAQLHPGSSQRSELAWPRKYGPPL